MRIDVLDEPELEFAGGVRHVDIRFGLMDAGPLDVLNLRTRSISVGLVGTSEAVEDLVRWLERCRTEIPAKESPYSNLFPHFPGFQSETAFRSTLILENRSQRILSQRDITMAIKAPDFNTIIESSVDLFFEEMRYLTETARPDVLLCAPSYELWNVVKGDKNQGRDNEIEDNRDAIRNKEFPRDFHDLLKARAMSLHTPMQLIWPHTYDPTKRLRQKRKLSRPKGQQDEATRAWNLHTALYYKAGGIPWRLVREPNQLTSCCVGISFYSNLERDQLLTSVAQVFNERGDGVVVRGGQGQSLRMIDTHIWAQSMLKHC